ncbi:MAG: leucine-rich repeat domain-containing protein [Rhodobacter sp.]|nr:leucine-rich repeat domain-containing protein [Rhodobacter sp.]
MSEADDAFAEAERLIEEARESGVTELDLSRVGTRALTRLPESIGTLDRLTNLDLSMTQVTDLTPLQPLTGLEQLLLIQTRVTNLSPLQTLSALRTLVLDYSQITDLAPLSSLENLQELKMWGCPVEDLKPLTQLQSLERLKLTNTRIGDVSALRNLRSLDTLWLSRTELVDLSPLSSADKLRNLTIKETQVADLRPIRALRHLVDAPGPDGITFEGCTAAKSDPRLAKIAEIEDNKERASQLFAYLDTLPPLDPPPPADSPRAPVYALPTDGPMQSTDAAPEAGDADQQALQADLRRKIAVLVEEIGMNNELAGLKASAEHYRIQIDRPLDGIRRTQLYSAANTLRTATEADDRAEAQGRINDLLPPKISGPLRDVVETHGLFFMGFPNAAEIHARMLAGLTGRRTPDETAAAEPLVRSLEDQPQALDPGDQAALADDLAAAKGEGNSAEIGEHSLRARLWNMFGAFGRRVYLVGAAGAGALVSHYFVQWVVAHETLIRTWLKLAQGAASGWFDAVMKIIRSALGL